MCQRRQHMKMTWILCWRSSRRFLLRRSRQVKRPLYGLRMDFYLLGATSVKRPVAIAAHLHTELRSEGVTEKIQTHPLKKLILSSAGKDNDTMIIMCVLDSIV